MTVPQKFPMPKGFNFFIPTLKTITNASSSISGVPHLREYSALQLLCFHEASSFCDFCSGNHSHFW